MFELKGRIALITGASQGIGETIARNLARQGAFTVCASLPSTEEDLKKVVAGIQAEGGQADYVLLDMGKGETIRAAVATVLERHGALHILVNNAGITKDKLMIQMKEEEFELVLDINLKGSWLATQAVAKAMMKQRWGRIINIVSVVGQMGNAGQSNYVASKAGLIGLTKTVAREFASRNITCNAVAPGYIATAMTDKLPEEVKAEFNRQIPLGRMGTPTDIANAVSFLASEEAEYMTGQVLSVNGGMLMP
ncbi:3-oxoacyl-[acyl-carrier-protein] reductase [Mesoterricola silvestris]|uniref:3-oxoacyl-[acyl-carrier-protein] reductase n=1 Tax=Mesoterricola silvestris TaxID=2927979 RepID=A0AA48K9E6_9BACT|nr:3-oxoacyl-[acyl-carrier-protein] reductase [Mesoterricola silvestris]BDU73924.1 beta-ketoacyl-ACP reductase [Mesoterricola silvestris]